MRSKKLFTPLLTLCPLLMAGGIGPGRVDSFATTLYKYIRITNEQFIEIPDSDNYKYSFNVENYGSTTSCFYLENKIICSYRVGQIDKSEWIHLDVTEIKNSLFDCECLKPGENQSIVCYSRQKIDFDKVSQWAMMATANEVYEYTFNHPNLVKMSNYRYKLDGVFNFTSGYTAKKSLEHPYMDNCYIRINVDYEGYEYVLNVDSGNPYINTSEILDLDNITINDVKLYYKSDTYIVNKNPAFDKFFNNVFAFIGVLVAIPVVLAVGIIALATLYKKKHPSKTNPDNEF